MSEVIFILCAIASIICSVALIRGSRKSKNRLLLWCGISFAILAINNIFLCVDLLIFPTVDLNGPFWRNLLGAIAGMVLLFGLIGELV